MIPRYSLKATWYVIMLCDYITKTSPQISRLELHTLINWSLYFKYFLYYYIVGSMHYDKNNWVCFIHWAYYTAFN